MLQNLKGTVELHRRMVCTNIGKYMGVIETNILGHWLDIELPNANARNSMGVLHSFIHSCPIKTRFLFVNIS